MMEIINEIRDDSLCLKVTGELNVSTSKEFEKAFMEEIAEDSSKIIIDLTELTFLSSAGIRALVVGAKEIKNKNGLLKVIIPDSGIVKESIEISGLLSILSFKNRKGK